MTMSSHRAITDDLIATMVRIKREAGVAQSQIERLIAEHASEKLWEERTGGIGFPIIEDVPQPRRGELLNKLAGLGW